jgi:abortive infection bacteriophage resistance protein
MTDRGLVISDEAECRRALTHIGYYRLSAYMLPLQIGGQGIDRHVFRPGTTFNQVLDLYTFDRQLRLIALDALERIEVALRAAITDTMSLLYGPFWYCDANRFTAGFQHARYLDELKHEIGYQDSKRRAIAIQHFFDRYDAPNLPPAWMLFEAIPFGKIAFTIRNLSRHDRTRIAGRFNIPEPILASWVHSFSYVRNLCAHHQRFWNRTFTITPKIATLYRRDLTPNSTAYTQLVTMQVLMRTISPRSRWPERLARLFAEHANISPRRLGFPEDWQQRQVWR